MSGKQSLQELIDQYNRELMRYHRLSSEEEKRAPYEGQEEMRRGLEELRRGLEELRQGVEDWRAGELERQRGLEVSSNSDGSLTLRPAPQPQPPRSMPLPEILPQPQIRPSPVPQPTPMPEMPQIRPAPMPEMPQTRPAPMPEMPQTRPAPMPEVPQTRPAPDRSLRPSDEPTQMSGTARLRVMASTARRALPVAGAQVRITGDDGKTLYALTETDVDGRTPLIELPAVMLDGGAPLPGSEGASTEYVVTVTADGFRPGVYTVQLIATTNSELSAELVPII